MDNDDANGSWEEWRRLVLHELERGSSERKDLGSKLDKLSESVTIIKAKAGIIGGLAGVLVSIVIAFL
jgi:hypothetical protein